MTAINIIDDLPEAPPPIGGDEDLDLLFVPQDWHPSYTDENKKGVATIIQWLNDTNRQQSWLARAAKINIGTFNQIVHGKYSSPPTKWIETALHLIATLKEREVTRVVPFVDTASVFKLACSVYQRVRVYQSMGVFVAEVGTGKTSAAFEYKKRFPNTTLVLECLPEMTPAAVLDDLCTQLNLMTEVRGLSTAQKFNRICHALKGEAMLLIVDEAEELQQPALELLRRIRDIAKIGIVLQGQPIKLLNMIKATTGRFNRIRSRISFWPEAIMAIDRRDAEEIVAAAFPDLEEIDPAAMDAMWAVCGGSARVLTESLIPNIRDYGLKRGRQLNAQLVMQVANEIMRMPVKQQPTARRPKDGAK
jgi:DNA transposition AAA+ family ATPase